MKRKCTAGSANGEQENHRRGDRLPDESTTSFSSWMGQHFWNRIPEAFEDENGFHLGSWPAARESESTQPELANADQGLE
jgi:hypothetical protein